MRNVEIKCLGIWDCVVWFGGVLEVNVEFVVFLVYVCFFNEIVLKGVWCIVCILGFCFSNFGF